MLSRYLLAGLVTTVLTLSLVTSAQAQLAAYNAGSAPDTATSPADQGWTELGVNAGNGATATAVNDDLGTGLNAWNITDGSTSDRPRYQVLLAGEDTTSMGTNGWVLMCKARGIGSSQNISWGVTDDTAFGGTGVGHRWGTGFRISGGELMVQWYGGGEVQVTFDGSGAAAYHEVKLIGQAGTSNATLYIDGNLIGTNTGQLSTGTPDKIEVGGVSTGGTGSQANWNTIKLAVLQPGDANNDGAVNLADLQILGDNWQSTTADWTTADFNWDGSVNLADLQIVGDNWGAGVGSDLAFDQALAQVGLVIPEPTALVLLGPAAMTLLLRRAAR